MLLPKDFVSTMSDEEKDRIMDEADVLDERGEKEAANRLRNTIPMNPILADGMKKVGGIQKLKDIGFNLNDAVKLFGEGWLNG